MKMIDPKAKSNLLYVSQEAFDQMQQIPTVDAELVVRCCDCKHMHCCSVGRPWCDMWEKELFILDGFCFYGNREVDNPRCRYYPSEDGFCHHGKQKEGDDNETKKYQMVHIEKSSGSLFAETKGTDF